MPIQDDIPLAPAPDEIDRHSSRSQLSARITMLFIVAPLVILVLVTSAAAYMLWGDATQKSELIKVQQQQLADLEQLLANANEDINVSSAESRNKITALRQEFKQLNKQIDAKLREQNKALTTSFKVQLNEVLVSIEKQNKALQVQMQTLDRARGAQELKLNAFYETQEELSATLSRADKKLRQLEKQLINNSRKTNKRLDDHLQWLNSINAFRREINQRIDRLQAHANRK